MPDLTTQPVLAKSRLKIPSPSLATIISTEKASNKTNYHPQKILNNYVTKIRTLGIGIFFLALLFVFLYSIHPNQIKNVLYPNSFLPFLVLTALSIFFIASYFLMNTRRGLFVATSILVLLWIKLCYPDDLIFSFGAAIALFFWFFLIEIVFLKIKHKSK